MVNFGKQLSNFFSLDNIFVPYEKDFNSLKDQKKKLLKTGLSFIDESIRGIGENEVFLFGADSGIGKTELASIISTNVAKQGIKTVLFALEAYRGEITNRKKFPQIKKMAKEKLNEHIYQKDWVYGQYQHLVEYEKQLVMDEELKGNLFIRYRTPSENYTIESLSADLDRLVVSKKIEFIVIDHLHHFDLHNDQSENTEMKLLIKKICSLGQMYGLPIVTFGQFKKKQSGEVALCPDYYEFHGTSELYRNVSCVITIAQDYESKMEINENEIAHMSAKEKYEYRQKVFTKHPTFFRIVKGRESNQFRKYLFSTTYDSEKNNYEKNYDIFLLTKGGTKKEEIDTTPIWAESRVRTKKQVLSYGRNY